MSSENNCKTSSNQSSDRLRVLFVTEDDPIYVVQFFSVFFDEYPRDKLDIIGITIVDAFHEPIWKTAWRMFRFYGLIDFVRLSIRFIGVKIRRKSIKTEAQKHNIDLISASSINDQEYIQTASNLVPDVIVSVAAPEIFRRGILDVPRIKCINIHSGRLPVYRGMMPNFWQLLHGEPHATITVHEMAEKLDAGGILKTLEYPLKEYDSLDRVIVGTKQEGARLMMDVLTSIGEGSVKATPLDMSNASYFSFPKPKDVRALRKRGHTML
jgi:methionyl-tRNA formyltransferase